MSRPYKTREELDSYIGHLFNTTDSSLIQHNKTPVKLVLRELTGQEYDREIVDKDNNYELPYMFSVLLEDGALIEVFEDEIDGENK